MVAFASDLVPGLNEFEVEVPTDLQVSGHGIAHARVTIGLPTRPGTTDPPPVLLISATADAGGNSSRQLLRRYAEVAMADGWIIVAADAVEPVAREEDDVPRRLVLDLTALALLDEELPGTARAPLAFGGISGGAKFAGWLAAAFVRQGRTVIGVYQAGINEDTLLPASATFDVLDANFRRIPVFLQSGRHDEIATPVDHREIAAKLKKAGFANVRIEYFAGEHEVDPVPLGAALRWFREVAGLPAVDP